MKTLERLRKLKAQAIERMKDLNELAAKETRDLNESEKAEYQHLKENIEAYESDIATLSASQPQPADAPAKPAIVDPEALRKEATDAERSRTSEIKKIVGAARFAQDKSEKLIEKLTSEGTS